MRPLLTGLTHEQIEDALRHILVSTLALYTLKNAKRPISTVIRELMDMECKASQLVGLILQLQAQNMRPRDLQGTLAGVLSFIPSAAAAKDFMSARDRINVRQSNGKNQNRMGTTRSIKPAFMSARKPSTKKSTQKRRPKNQL